MWSSAKAGRQGGNLHSPYTETRPRNVTYYYRIQALSFVTGASAWVNAAALPIPMP